MSRIRSFISTIVILGYLILTIVSFNHFHDEDHAGGSDGIGHLVDNAPCSLCLASTLDRFSAPPDVQPQYVFCWSTSNFEFSATVDLERKINQRRRFRLAPKTSPPILSAETTA